MADNNLDTDKIRKYWKMVFMRAFEPVWGELAMRALIVLFFLILIILIGSALLTLIGSFPIPFFEARLEDFKSTLSTSFWALLVMVVLILLNMYRASAEIYYEQNKKIDELTPVESNIDIILPDKDSVFSEGDTIPIVIHNKNQNFDINGCHCRIEFILRISTNQGEALGGNLFHHVQHQKNLLWNRKALEDGTIKISAGGKEVIKLLEVRERDFKILFQDNESLEDSVPLNHAFYGYIMYFKVYGLIDKNPLKEVSKIFTIQGLLLSTIDQQQSGEISDPEGLGKLLSDQKPKLRIVIREAVDINVPKK